MKINVSRDLTPCLVQFLCRKIRDTAGYVGRLQGKRPFRSGGRGGEIEHLNHSWAMKMKTVGSKFAYCDIRHFRTRYKQLWHIYSDCDFLGFETM